MMMKEKKINYKIVEAINKLRKLYELKQIYRANSVGNRKESSAEHSWSCAMLADFFLERMQKNNLAPKIDRLKVYELLLYHDIVEIEAGDIPIHYEKKRIAKKENELKALAKLRKNLPSEIGSKLARLFHEFEDEATPEARFARAVDSFDSLVHELDYKADWKGWTEEMVRKYHGKKIAEYPEIKTYFEAFLKDIKNKGYFDKSDLLKK